MQDKNTCAAENGSGAYTREGAYSWDTMVCVRFITTLVHGSLYTRFKFRSNHRFWALISQHNAFKAVLTSGIRHTDRYAVTYIISQVH